MKRSPLKPSTKPMARIKPLSGIFRTASLAPAKLRKCKVCRVNPVAKLGALVCGPECAVAMVAAAKLKAERKKDKARKDAIKTRSDWLKEAQAAFNAFIRARDINQPCISSGRPLSVGAIGGGFDAGHYRSIGSAPHLRFDERNVHAQSKHDNRYLAGNAVSYRIGLIARIGLEAVEALEADQEPRKYTIDDLKAIRAEYKAKLRALQALDKGVV